MKKKKVISLFALLALSILAYFSVKSLIEPQTPESPVQKPKDGDVEKEDRTYPPGVTGIIPNELGVESKKSSWVGYLRKRRIQVMISECRSLDLPQVELIFCIRKGGRNVPVAALGLGMDSPPGDSHDYHLSVSFKGTSGACGLRLGVARDPEEAKLTHILQMGRSYQVLVQYPTASDVKSKRITIPMDLKEGMIYQMPIVLDEPDSSPEITQLKISGTLGYTVKKRKGWRNEVIYYLPDNQTFHSRLTETGEFEIKTLGLGGLLCITHLNRERGHVLALARNVQEDKLTPEDFQWRVSQSELSEFNLRFIAPLVGIELVGFKLRKDDPRPVFWQRVPRTLANSSVSVSMNWKPGDYFVNCLIREKDRRLVLDLGKITLKQGEAVFSAFPREQVIKQKSELLKKGRTL